MSLAIDGTIGATQHAAAGTQTAILTTAHSPDVLVAYIVINSGTVSVSSVSGFGLAWHLRKREAGGTTVSIEEWYALAPTTVSGTISFVLTPVTAAASTGAFGVSGANSTAPFDPNALLPYGNTSTSATVTGTITTTNSNDMLLSFAGLTSTEASSTLPASFTAIGAFQGTTGPSGGAAEQVVTAVQSAAPVLWHMPTSRVWVTILDAIQLGGVGLGTMSDSTTPVKTIGSGKGTPAGTMSDSSTAVKAIGSGNTTGAGTEHDTLTAIGSGKGTPSGTEHDTVLTVGSGRGAGAGTEHDSVLAIGSGKGTGAGTEHDTVALVGSGHGTAVGTQHDSVLTVGSGTKGGAGRHSDTASVVASEQGRGAGRQSTTQLSIGSGKGAGAGAVHDSVALIAAKTATGAGLMRDSLTTAIGKSISAGGGCSNSIVIYARTNPSQYIGVGEKEAQGITYGTVEAAPGIYRLGMVFP